MTGNANGDVWANNDAGYIRRGNAKSIFHGTGTEIAALDPVTPTSRYAFAGNGNDSVGSNNLTANGSPTYGSDGGVYGQYVILNGSSQYFTASANTVFDVTTQDFSLWGYLYRTSSTSNQRIANKFAGSPLSGYNIDINNNNLRIEIFAGASGSANATSTTSLSTSTWYFWSVSVARAGNLMLNLYNMSTGALETITTNISSLSAGSLTNSATFTVGQQGGGSYFPGRIDHLNVLMGTAITAQNVQDIISKLHGGQKAECHGTSGGFTSGITYKRDVENTTWYQLVDTNNTQTITGDKTLSGTTTFNSAPVIANNIPIRWKDSGGTTRNVAYIDGSNDLFIQNDANGFAYVQTDNGSGAGNLVTRFTFGKGAAQGAAGITYYEPLSSGHVDAGLVNPLFHTYGRYHLNLRDLDYMSTTGTGSPTFTKKSLGFDLVIQTSGVANDTALMYTLSTAGSVLPLRRDRKFELYFLVVSDNTTANYEFECGLTAIASITSTQSTANHCAVQYKSGTSANFIASNGNGTSQTTTTSGVALGTSTIYLISIINNETNLKFYINGSLIATHTTNLPNSTTYMDAFFFVKTLAGSNRKLYVYSGEVWGDIS